MAEIHHTTLSPSKLELLTGWLPGRPWYRGNVPALQRAGGFRLDDPDGEVGIEIMLAADADGVVYQVPLGYRGAPLESAESALIGTSEHGVLGRRYIYDGTRDPIVVAQLLALLTGDVEAQHQSESDTLDRSVTGRCSVDGPFSAGPVPIATDDEHGTSIAVEPGDLALRIVRVATATGTPLDAVPDVVGAVEADVRTPGRDPHRTIVAVLRHR